MAGDAPTVGGRYVCRNTASPGWAGESVTVLDVCGEMRAARVKADPDRYGDGYTTIVSWDDLVPEVRRG